MRTVGLVALLSGCSLAMNNTPQTWRPAYRDPPCSESYVRPGFDGMMAVSAATGAALTLLGPYSSDHGCGGVIDQYTNQRPCGTIVGYVGVSTAIAIAFAASSYIGVTRANACAKKQDERDAYLAQQGIQRELPRYQGDATVGIGLGIIVGGIGLGLGAATFPRTTYHY